MAGNRAYRLWKQIWNSEKYTGNSQSSRIVIGLISIFRYNCKQLLDEVSVISRIIKVEVRVISQRLRLITLAENWIILDIPKTKSTVPDFSRKSEGTSAHMVLFIIHVH